jgi:Na+/H+-dicarboxylate symporter
MTKPLTLWFSTPLWQRILGALALGLIAGLVLGEQAAAVKWIGDLFVRLIRMLVTPLVFVTIAAGVIGLGDARRLGSVGLRAIGLFALTAALAVSVGVLIGEVLQPGAGVQLAGATPMPLGEARTPAEQLMGIVPLNPIEALAKGDMLAVIFFAVMVGVGVILCQEKGAPVAALLQSASDVMLKLVRVVMETAPFGVFGLIAAAIGVNGAGVLTHVAHLALCVLIGAVFQSVVVHGLIIRLVARLPVRRFFAGIVDALLVAFSTASSSATLPVAITVLERNLGVKPVIAQTVLPLGATIGRDGTALYVGLLSVFAAQAFGVHLGLTQYMLIVLTATLAALGSAPVPSASLFMLATVLSAIGIDGDRTALLVGFILPFDRLLDMIRTVPNATSNMTVATTVARFENEIDYDRFKAGTFKS